MTKPLAFIKMYANQLLCIVCIFICVFVFGSGLVMFHTKWEQQSSYRGHFLSHHFISVSLPGYVFCMLHRLPEQHDCLFDHLGRGREEAVLKMVKLDRKVGRSCQRIGEECS